jgi:hypothetical protein
MTSLRICFRSTALAAFRSLGRSSPNELSAVRRGQRYWLLLTPTLVFNLDLLHLPELVCPDALQRPRHEAVLRLDGIVLPARPLRLVTRPLALERPLMLERRGFVLKFAESGNRQSESIRCQRFKQPSFDYDIDTRGAHLLATWLTFDAGRRGKHRLDSCPTAWKSFYAFSQTEMRKSGPCGAV